VPGTKPGLVFTYRADTGIFQKSFFKKHKIDSIAVFVGRLKAGRLCRTMDKAVPAALGLYRVSRGGARKNLETAAW
jgi:hypothetical protein